MNNTTMDQNMELEMMIGYDEERKFYYCLSCTYKGHVGKYMRLFTARGFKLHLRGKKHAESHPYIKPVYKVFTEMLYGITEEELDRFYSIDSKDRYIIDHYVQHYHEYEKEIKEKKISVKDIEIASKIFKDTNSLCPVYTLHLLKKVKPYRQALKNIIKESTIMCKDVMGIVAEYI